MLWVDQYRPTKLDDLSYHNDTITERLRALARNPSSMPHLFVYGPSGAGKKTRIHCLLQAIYGNAALKLKLDQRTFTVPAGSSTKNISINMVTSSHHMEISPGDAGLNDRFVIQHVIKEIASNQNIAAVGQTSKKTFHKTVVLTEVDRLSRQAQAALRRTMEKYATSCRLILCCESLSRVMEPVRSRCLPIRVAAPSVDDIARVLQQTARKVSVTLPEVVAVDVAHASQRNLRRALLQLEALHVACQGNWDEATAKDVPLTDWHVYIRQIAVDITKEQSPARLSTTREKLYELLVNCIPPTIILKTLVQELLRNLDDSIKPAVMEWAAFYEHRIAMGSKEIFHLEAFVAKYMALYKKYLNDLFADDDF